MPRERSTRTPVADQMYEVLLKQFLAGERKAGEALNIGALTRELEVSQTPLREALARLEHTGLVTREALRGYRVAPELSATEIGQLFDARVVLEPALAAQAALLVAPDFLEELADTIADLDGVAEVADLETSAFEHYWSSDYAFHRLIAEHSGNIFLAQAFIALDGPMQRFRLFTKRGRTGVAHAIAEHRTILDALRSGDPERAAGAMRKHLISAKGHAVEHFNDPSAYEPGNINQPDPQQVLRRR